jgi:hypothetical protein
MSSIQFIYVQCTIFIYSVSNYYIRHIHQLVSFAKHVVTKSFLVLVQMSGIDLNASPTDDELFYDTEPQFCTQAAPEYVEESPDPMQQDNVADGGDSGVHSGARRKHPQAHTSGPGGGSIPTTNIPTETTTYPDMAGGDADGGGMQEEVISSPSEPFLGMRFDTLKAAKAHYNAYAAKIGFSVKSHTSKRKAHTNELEKQQFVYNKFRRPKTEEKI